MGPWAFGVPLLLVSALGLLLNAYVLLVVLGLGKQTLQQQHQQTANTLLLVHLGAVEAALCLLLLAFTTGGWPVSGGFCALHGFLLAVLHPVALWTVTGLNCDRYYAIAAPLHYAALVSPRRVSLGLAASWIGAVLLCLPPFSGLAPPYRHNPDLGCCVPEFGNGAWGIAASLYGAVYALLGLVLPATLITICNLRVLGIARYHRHRIASAIYEVTLSAQVTITHQRNPFFVPTVTSPTAGGPPRFHSAACTVMQLVGSLYLLYFPYCGLILWEAFGAATTMQQQEQQEQQQQQQEQQEQLHRPHAHPQLASLASLLLAGSPPLNGLLYGLRSPMLRRSVQNYRRKKTTESELQQEIQARTPSAAGSRRPSGSGPAVSLFPFPPLQRRLSEVLVALADSRNVPGFESDSIGGSIARRSKLQPAASCNTLRVPALRSETVRSSASAASLMGSRYRGNDLAALGGRELASSRSETPSNSPRILVTRAYSVESEDGGSSPLLLERSTNLASPVASRPQKRRWRHISTESDSSTGSSDASSVWTTGVALKIAKGNLKNSMDNWPAGKRFARVRTLEEGALLVAARPKSDNSESSEAGTDTTLTTTTAAAASTLLSTHPIDRKEKIEGPRVEEDPAVASKNREPSESEPSWSSVEEEDAGKSDENGKLLLRRKDEAEKLRIEPNDRGRTVGGADSTVVRKFRKNRKEKDGKGRVPLVDQEGGALQLRPLLTFS